MMKPWLSHLHKGKEQMKTKDESSLSPMYPCCTHYLPGSHLVAVLLIRWTVVVLWYLCSHSTILPNNGLKVVLKGSTRA